MNQANIVPSLVLLSKSKQFFCLVWKQFQLNKLMTATGSGARFKNLRKHLSLQNNTQVVLYKYSGYQVKWKYVVYFGHNFILFSLYSIIHYLFHK